MDDRAQPGVRRGDRRLLFDCAALTLTDDARPPAFTRLEQAVGSELARRLVAALGDRPRPCALAA